MGIPTPHAAQCIGGATAKQGREHDAKDCAQQLLVATQAACDLLHEVLGEAQVVEGLFESLKGPLGLLLIASQALVGFLTTALSGFGVFFGVSFAWGHGVLLRTVMISRSGLKVTLSHQVPDGKPASDKATPHGRSVSISPL